MLARSLALLALATSACGDDGSPGTDGGPVLDGILVDGFDNASCGNDVRFTGELVDWDSNASFCGINEAVLEVAGGGAQDSTAPNGRFDLCIPRTPATTRLTVELPTANSQCTVPPSMYTTPTIVVARPDVILAGAFYSTMAFTVARRTSLFTEIGAAFDPTKAHVHVHVHGTPRAVSIAATHGTAQAITGTTWAAGSTGKDVFFPNVDVAGAETMLTVAGGAVGTGAIPIVAGTITNVTVFAP